MLNHLHHLESKKQLQCITSNNPTHLDVLPDLLLVQWVPLQRQMTGLSNGHL
jgi:hypothetical protein